MAKKDGKAMPEELSGCQEVEVVMPLDLVARDLTSVGLTSGLSTGVPGVAGPAPFVPGGVDLGAAASAPYAGLPSNMNPWPDVYFTGLTYGGEGMDRLGGIRSTIADAELQVQRERLLAAQQIRTLQELLARERLNFQAVSNKNKAEKDEVDGKIVQMQRIVDELNAKIKEQQNKLKENNDTMNSRDEEILKLKGLLENEKKLRDTADRTLDFERKGNEEKITNLERALQLEKDALQETRHAKDKEREAATTKEQMLNDALDQERRNLEAGDSQAKLAAMEADEKIRLLKKQVEDGNARVVEAEAKSLSARDLFEGEKEALTLQLNNEQGKVKALQALQGTDAASWEKKMRMVDDALAAERSKSFEVKTKLEGEKTAFGRDILRLQDLLERERLRVSELEDRLDSERMRLNKEIAIGKEDLDLERKKLLNAANRDQKDLALAVKEKHEMTMSLEREKNKRQEAEKRLDADRKNFDKLKLDFEERIDSFRNRNTDIEDELRREIATLQKLIETLREQVQFERKRREVHDVNQASKATTSLVSGALSKGADRHATSMAGGSKYL